ncbi:hypothetical protein SEA_SATIS_65 [Streptomyces phage Satis]|nr:hypothetical protein SEA_SATIS_65 [Streptomyces phage Satis]QBZ71963.1 hypothetical protein SEA_KRADAL_65 [Streptomyces phage Kradal]QPL14382.1 hypothetical protein SEA_EHYELIMAYOE_65 [Streptomyces phage EhyElimayoE]
MLTIQIPPSGIPARFPLTIPSPGDLGTLGGVRVYFLFNLARPDIFVPKLSIDGIPYALMDSALGPTSITRIAQFSSSIPAPVDAEISVNEGGSLQPGNTVTVYAWGAQTLSGVGALNPDEGGEPSTMTDTIEVGTVEVVTWQEWNRMTGANQGEGS